jgi:putative nucleotidyltransferase with HDIG domain
MIYYKKSNKEKTMDNIQKTLEFLKTTFYSSKAFKENPSEVNYRVEHSIRVANIAKEIALKENLNVEGLVIAGLLHDISYCDGFATRQDWLDHGRKAARITREFLKTLDLDELIKKDICYGIAIHVDDVADFEGVQNAFALTVGDADNIDRFDVYRIYETLQHHHYSDLSLEDRKETLKNLNFEYFENMTVGTPTARHLLDLKLDYQKDFYKRLEMQMENSVDIK